MPSGAAKTDDGSHGDFFPGVCPVQRNPVYFPARDTRRVFTTAIWDIFPWRPWFPHARRQRGWRFSFMPHAKHLRISYQVLSGGTSWPVGLFFSLLPASWRFR